MAEISARDLRRLEALEERLGKSQEERKTLIAERRELRGAVTANARRIREVEREAADTAKQVEAVLAENAALAQRLDDATGDVEQLRSASLQLREQADAAQSELKGTQEALAVAQRELGSLKNDRDGLARSLALASEQLAGRGIEPVLPAADVAKLVDDLVVDLGSRLPGLAVRDGEMRLKVAFGKVGDASGFVVPSAASPPEILETLHELALRFDRPP